jgi:hypothetical protein
MIGHDVIRARGRAARALIACAVLSTLAAPDAGACPSPNDYAMFPSTLRTIQPEPLIQGATACPGNTNTSPCGAHRVYVPAANHPEPHPNQIVLFLPGTQSEPNKYDDVLSTAAFAGFRTIGLAYDNRVRLETACGNNCGCYGLARREIAFGGNLTPAVNVLAGDTIISRLYWLLRDLDANFPNEGWDGILSRDDMDMTAEATDIDWDSIVVVGHSQGAGNGLILSKNDVVDGILLLDGGNDECTSGGRTYAQWHDLFDPPTLRRAFVHDRSGSFLVPDSFIEMEFGLNATDFDVLDNVWPTAFEVASTNQEPPPGCTDHGSMAYDGCMPDALTGGNPAATPDASYLFPFYLEWVCEVGFVGGP